MYCVQAPRLSAALAWMCSKYFSSRWSWGITAQASVDFASPAGWPRTHTGLLSGPGSFPSHSPSGAGCPCVFTFRASWSSSTSDVSNQRSRRSSAYVHLQPFHKQMSPLHTDHVCVHSHVTLCLLPRSDISHADEWKCTTLSKQSKWQNMYSSWCTMKGARLSHWAQKEVCALQPEHSFWSVSQSLFYAIQTIFSPVFYPNYSQSFSNFITFSFQTRVLVCHDCLFQHTRLYFLWLRISSSWCPGVHAFFQPQSENSKQLVPWLLCLFLTSSWKSSPSKTSANCELSKTKLRFPMRVQSLFSRRERSLPSADTAFLCFLLWKHRRRVYTHLCEVPFIWEEFFWSSQLRKAVFSTALTLFSWVLLWGLLRAHDGLKMNTQFSFAQKSSHGGRWAKISELLTFGTLAQWSLWRLSFISSWLLSA